MFKALLLPNYISEQPQYLGMLVILPNIEKISSVTFKGQRSWTPKVDFF